MKKVFKFLSILIILLVAKLLYNEYKLNQTSHFVITSDTNVSAIPGLSKYVTQEEVDSFSFRYWDIDNNYTKFLKPEVVPLREFLKAKNTTKVLNYLKEHNLSVDVKIEDGTTPLMYSSFYDDINTTKELIKLGANIHQKDKYKLSPLAYAIEHNSTKTVKLLLDNGVKFDEIKSIQGYLASPNYGGINGLVIYGNRVDVLYEHSWIKYMGSKIGQPPLTYAISRNLIELAKLMLESDYNPKAYFNYGDTIKTSDNFNDIISYEEEQNLNKWHNGNFSRYDYTHYAILEDIPNYEPMLELMLKYNVPGQPTKEQLKEAYDECYKFYYDKCFYDYKNQCNPVFEIYPEIYALKNKYRMFKRYCPDKNGTFKDTKEFINYKNAKNRSYSISSIIASDMKNVFIKDKNITLENLMIDTYKKSTNENEKDFLKTYYLKNYKNDF
ncbi:ankyrin repeat domain-containing protein [Campylobacter geochelonis]|uniref:ankyrin repeat domain-containing protein n=1 Tax=Campylobacter geochelonis TaxID=1780362 RepID=UPI000770A1A7|nr:ankyrin repeat domain-containing protein [Campylobacter geochelonis]CZE48393.1 ankyrin repeat-containing protein [Campylobacter geochelonis]